MIFAADRCRERAPNIYVADSVTEVSNILNPRLGDIAMVIAEGVFLVYKLVEGDNHVIDGNSVLGSNSCEYVWLQATTESLSIETFGADPTGELDSRNAIQMTANVLRAQGGGTIIIPPGNFRIVATLPIYLGDNVNILGTGGKLWVSLPDGYTNNNDYATPNQTYTALNVLDQNGDYVSWTSTPLQMPWNGKTQVFTRAQGTIENIWIDFGWGTTDAPSGVLPITGVRIGNEEEYTYYQGFNDSRGAIFTNCYMRHAPGAYIEVGYDVTVHETTFVEFGDHVFYFGQDVAGTQINYHFLDNTIIAARAASGVVGQTNYVFQTQRDALKFRGNTHVTVTGNSFLGSNGLLRGITLEVNDDSGTQPGDVSDVTITGNTFRGLNFIDFVGARSVDYPTDYRVKNAIIHGNIAICDNQTAVLFRGACDGVIIADNFFDSGSGGVAFFYGSPRWTEPIKNLSFRGNTCKTTANIVMSIAGVDLDMDISNNRFENPTVNITSSYNVINITNNSTPSVNDSIPVNTQPTNFKRLILADNLALNWFSMMGDAGYPAFDNAATYPYLSLNAGAQIVRCVVSSGGALYVNTATVNPGGGAPPAAGWAAYTRADGELLIHRNIRYANSIVLSNNSSFLAALSAAAALLRMNYFVYHALNENHNSLGNVIGYSLGSVTATRFNPSSWYDEINTDTIKSGGSTGRIEDYDVLSARVDFKFEATGACDEWNFFYQETLAKYINLNYESSGGEKQLRLFKTASGVAHAVGLALSTDGFVEGLEMAGDPAAPVANGWRLYAKDNGAGKTQLGVLFQSGAFIPIATEV